MKTFLKILPITILTGLMSILAAAQPPTVPDEELTSRVTLHRPAHSSSQTGDFDSRVKLDPKESISIDLTFTAADGIVRLAAPNGGTINNSRGAAQIDIAKQGRNHQVAFAVGSNAGRYTLEISHGNRTKTIEFWVGPEPPSGKPGPALHFTGNH
jgi:hypothetical protein